MNLKRASSAALALTLAASLAPAALAEDLPLLISPAPAKTYQTQLFLNGEVLDASHIPAAQPDLIPMRLLSESDGGFAEWYQEENQGFFYVADHRIVVYFSDLSVELDGEKLEGVAAALTDGVTFLPAEALALVDGVEVDLNPEMDVDRVDVTTPNGQPLTKLANSIIEEIQMGSSMKNSPEELKEYLGVDPANFDQIVAYSPMMVNADTIFIGHYASEADKDAAKAQFQARLEAVQQSFENYLPDSYDMAMNGQVVESEDGEWLMLIISADNDKAIEMFEAGVKAMAEAEA